MKSDKDIRKIRGARLAQARENAGLSLEEARIAFGVAYSTYAAHENGTTAYTLNAAIDYAKRYKVSLDWLVHGIGEGPKSKDAAKQSEVALKSALIAYGVDVGDLPPVMKAISGFVSESDEQSQQDQRRDQSAPASRRRVSTP